MIAIQEFFVIAIQEWSTSKVAPGATGRRGLSPGRATTPPAFRGSLYSPVALGYDLHLGIIEKDPPS